MFSLSENELQAEVINLINAEQFSERIEGIDRLNNILAVDSNKHFIPDFQIDFQLKTKYARRASEVIESLFSLELINDDGIRNISIQKDTKNNKERLYPDLILMNDEKKRIILIELKKDRQTEREAITELLAYAIEIKNHLPNIADSDIHLIVISPVYNTLLDHAISSLVLGTRFNVLALKVDYKEQNLLLKVHFPNSWTDIWQKQLPPFAISSVSLAPYNYEQKEEPDKAFLFDMINDIIMFESGRHNSQGFFIIWQNILPGGAPAEFCISLYQINPFVFLNASIGNNNTLNINQPLSQYILKYEPQYNHPESLLKIAEAVRKVLEKWYKVDFEDFSSWTDHMHLGSTFRGQANPLVFNSWGDVGDYLRYLFFHPSLSRFISEKQLDSPLAYRDPIFGIEIVNRISGLTLFNDGAFRLSSLYKFGAQLREYLQVADMFYRSKIENKKFEILSPRLFYCSVDLLSSLREIQYRVNSTTNKFQPFKGIKLGFYDISEDQTDNVMAFFDWFVKSFLDGNPLHQSVFSLSFNWCILFSKDFSPMLDASEKKQLESMLIMFVRDTLSSIIVDEVVGKTTHFGDKLTNLISVGFFDGTLPLFKSKKDALRRVESIRDTEILNSFESVFLEILDIVYPEVFHELTPMEDMSLVINDWEHLRHQLVKRFNEGHKHGAIYIDSNGNIAVCVLGEELRFLAPIIDPEKEVYVLTNESGIGVARKVSWEAVRTGKAFKT